MKKIIKYHNNFTEAIYKLDTVAKKLLLAVILYRNKDNQIKIHRNQLKEVLGTDPSQSHQSVEKAIEKLMTTIITIRDIDKPMNWQKYQLLKTTKYKDGVLYSSIYEDLLPYFNEAQERLFTMYNIENIKPLTSTYSIKIYELLKQYQKVGSRTFTVKEFRQLLDCQDKYKYFKDFKKRTLEAAKRELAEKTDLCFDYEVEKFGRTPEKIHFKIWTNSKTNIGKEAIKLQAQTEEEKQEEKKLKQYLKANIKVEGELPKSKIIDIYKDKDKNYIIKAKNKKGTVKIKLNQSIINTIDFIKTHLVLNLKYMFISL